MCGRRVNSCGDVSPVYPLSHVSSQLPSFNFISFPNGRNTHRTSEVLAGDLVVYLLPGWTAFHRKSSTISVLWPLRIILCRAGFISVPKKFLFFSAEPHQWSLTICSVVLLISLYFSCGLMPLRNTSFGSTLYRQEVVCTWSEDLLKCSKPEHSPTSQLEHDQDPQSLLWGHSLSPPLSLPWFPLTELWAAQLRFILV